MRCWSRKVHGWACNHLKGILLFACCRFWLLPNPRLSVIAVGWVTWTECWPLASCWNSSFERPRSPQQFVSDEASIHHSHSTRLRFHCPIDESITNVVLSSKLAPPIVTKMLLHWFFRHSAISITKKFPKRNGITVWFFGPCIFVEYYPQSIRSLSAPLLTRRPSKLRSAARSHFYSSHSSSLR